MRFLKKLKSGNFWVSLISCGVLIAEVVFGFEIKTEYLNQILLGILGLLAIFGIITDHGEKETILTNVSNKIDNSKQDCQENFSNIKSICDTISLMLNKVSINSNTDNLKNNKGEKMDNENFTQTTNEEILNSENFNQTANEENLHNNDSAQLVGETEKDTIDSSNNQTTVVSNADVEKDVLDNQTELNGENMPEEFVEEDSGFICKDSDYVCEDNNFVCGEINLDVQYKNSTNESKDENLNIDNQSLIASTENQIKDIVNK